MADHTPLLWPSQGLTDDTPANSASAAPPTDRPDNELLEASKSDRVIRTMSMVRRNNIVGVASVIPITLGVLGFIPSYVVGFADGKWYFDALRRQDWVFVTLAKDNIGTFWDFLVTFHSLTALGWFVCVLLQVSTGATGPPGSARKMVHRKAGYVSAAIGTLMSVEAFVLQVLKTPYSFELFVESIGESNSLEKLGVSLAIYLNLCMIGMNLVVGIRFARAKQYKRHKVAMGWTIGWTAVPGLTRVAEIILNWLSGGSCALEQLGLYSWPGLLLLMACMFTASRLLCEVETKVFISNALVMMVILIVDGIGAGMIWYNGDWCRD